MGIRTVLMRLFSNNSNVIGECRRCGANVKPDTDECPECGSNEVGRYRVE
jgi:rRNA maturation endonuclease Nob1